MHPGWSRSGYVAQRSTRNLIGLAGEVCAKIVAALKRHGCISSALIQQ
jgi:hypothetical protein